MEIFWIVVGITVFLSALVFITSYICFRLTFYAVRKEKNSEEFTLPPGKIYEQYRDIMFKWMKESREIPFKEVEIISFDGLLLKGKYYEGEPGAPVELMMHGYRGEAERDLCGGIQRAFALKRNVLIVDQRACGKSEGNVISFGVNESRDCRAWVEYIIKMLGPDVRIILTGISMGAATVVMAAGRPLPENVIGILADCGYSSAKAIIKNTIKEMKLPADLLYPFVKLGAKIYGHFDVEENPPIEAIKKCTKPVIFIHGEDDRFVPCYMSRELYDACTAPKRLLTVAGAGHGLSYMVDGEGYLKALDEFAAEMGIPNIKF